MAASSCSRGPQARRRHRRAAFIGASASAALAWTGSHFFAECSTFLSTAWRDNFGFGVPEKHRPASAAGPEVTLRAYQRKWDSRLPESQWETLETPEEEEPPRRKKGWKDPDVQPRLVSSSRMKRQPKGEGQLLKTAQTERYFDTRNLNDERQRERRGGDRGDEGRGGREYEDERRDDFSRGDRRFGDRREPSFGQRERRGGDRGDEGRGGREYEDERRDQEFSRGDRRFGDRREPSFGQRERRGGDRGQEGRGGREYEDERRDQDFSRGGRRFGDRREPSFGGRRDTFDGPPPGRRGNQRFFGDDRRMMADDRRESRGRQDDDYAPMDDEEERFDQPRDETPSPRGRFEQGPPREANMAAMDEDLDYWEAQDGEEPGASRYEEEPFQEAREPPQGAVAEEEGPPPPAGRPPMRPQSSGMTSDRLNAYMQGEPDAVERAAQERAEWEREQNRRSAERFDRGPRREPRARRDDDAPAWAREDGRRDRRFDDRMSGDRGYDERDEAEGSREKKLSGREKRRLQNRRPGQQTGRVQFSASFLTKNIKGVRTAKDLSTVLQKALRHINLNSINIVAALSKLAGFRKPAPGVPPLAEEISATQTTWQEVSRITRRILLRNEVREFELASMASSLAKLQKEAPVLMDIVPNLLAAMGQMHVTTASLDDRWIANVLWALGTLEPRMDEGQRKQALRVFDLLQDRTASMLPKLSARDLAQVVWGLAAFPEFGTEEGQAPLLEKALNAVVKQAPQVSTKSSLVDLPMVACALSKAGQAVTRGNADKVLEKIAFRLAPVLPKLQRWELAALVWTWEQRVPKGLQDKARLAAAAARQDETKLLAKLREKTWVRENFSGLLQEEAALRNVQPEEIQKAPYGPDMSWYERIENAEEPQQDGVRELVDA
eukprot:TRINITY_DN2403_c0_g1_i1.p1 TRINITY_DN2403_c0_g1~~TRINITY_DN2403_c0_g1_i1.p1  ORF type:complete len:917 (-),score=186.93 TRINITY_DN2403_c0_g1_i1:5-2689(-)